MTTSDPARVRGTEGRSDAHGSEVTAAPEHGQRDEDEGRRLFSRRARHAGLVWVAATIPIAAVLGVFVHGQHDYLLAWVLIGALNLVPAFGLAIIAYRRAADADKNFWKLISIGVGSMVGIGLILLVGVLLDTWQFVFAAAPLAVLCVLVFFSALFAMVRSRSSIRVNPLDILESAMIVIGVGAFAPLVWGNRPVDIYTSWFTWVGMLTSIGILAGFCWSLAMFRRVKGQRLPDEALGMAIGFLCGINAVAQTTQGLTGFDLPSSPLLVFQALCFGVLLVLPLQLTDNTPLTYDTFPPLEQARARSFDTIAIALLVPMLVITIVRQSETEWAAWYFAGVASVLLLLALARGKLAMRETRRLYEEVEQSADARRQMLSDVLQSADHDRHRVAAQLHQQATGFYVAFMSFLRVVDESQTNPVLQGMRDDLEQQAEDLRELALAVRPLEANDSGVADLKATIAAYFDSLYLDATTPRLDIRINDDVALDWTTETIIMRILQEALRNIAKHAHAQNIIVSIDEHEAGLALRVIDDGVGFDAKRLMFESGNEYMRKFASHLGGHLFIESEPGQGTTVIAVLGAPTGAVRAPAPRTMADAKHNHLRLVTTPTPDDSEPQPPLASHGRGDTSDRGATSTDAGEQEDAAESTRHLVPSDLRGVQARLAQRRAVSDGRRFIYFRSVPGESMILEVIEVGLAALLLLPLGLVSATSIAPRADSLMWILIMCALGSVVVAFTVYFLWTFRRADWDGFDPRAVFATLVVGLLAIGAYGVATGGQPALFTLSLVLLILIAVIAGSPTMIALLWALAVTVLGAVLVVTDAPVTISVWVTVIFAAVSALIAWMVHLTVWKSRDGLAALEGIADFASYASGARQWEPNKETMLQKIAAAVDATTVMVFERPRGTGRQLRELARWIDGHELSPFLESDLRRAAEQAHPDRELELTRASHSRSHLLTIAASSTAADVVLAVQLKRIGPRDDAALIAAVSMLASAIDRSSLIDGLLGEALTDPLTGLANRRQLQEHLTHAIGRAVRVDEPLSVAMVDLDHFKNFNDTWGHAAGDRVLMAFAHMLCTRLRAQDIASRYGGEEFCLLLPGTTAADAKLVLDELQQNLHLIEGQPVTFSGGVAELCANETADTLVARADRALYQAKDAGRRKTCIAEEHTALPADR